MKQGWEIKKLGDVCELYQPKTISLKEMVDNGDYPVFGANGIIGKYYKYNHEEP
jgi:type I restriction enzyme S subunit